MTYKKRDSCYGTVFCRNAKGVYLQLDNGEQAFAYGFHDLKNGTTVCCSVRKQAQGYQKTLVSIDSTLYCAA